MLLNTMHGSFTRRETIGQLCSMQGTRLKLLPGFHNPTSTLFSLILSSCVVPGFRLAGSAPLVYTQHAARISPAALPCVPAIADEVFSLLLTICKGQDRESLSACHPRVLTPM